MKSPLLFMPVLLFALLTGCTESETSKTPEPSLAPKQVTTARVESAALSSRLEFPGTVIPRNRAVVMSKIQAWVTRVRFSLGDTVRKGYLLIELDSRDLEARVSQSRAASDKAAAELRRYQALLAKQLVSQQEFDAVETDAEAMKAALAESEAMLSYGKIVAPFDGVVTQRFIDLGAMAEPGAPLLTLEESGGSLFSAMLPETQLRQHKVGDSVRIQFPTDNMTVSGAVTELPSGVDPESHAFEIRTSLPPIANIRPGMFGRLQLGVSNEKSLWIPRVALIKRGQLDLVYAVDENQQVRLRLIRVGRQSPEQIEVLAGLRDSERVVVAGQTFLSDGDVVEEMK